jgi:hypothetical protein
MLALYLRITCLEIKMDSYVTIDLVKSNKNTNVFSISIMDDCWYLLGRLEHLRINHIFREANTCTDLFSKVYCA